MTPEEIIPATERTWNLQKMFNIKHGETREELVLPKRFYTEPQAEGPAQGRVVDLVAVDHVVEEYFEARGWDLQKGAPMVGKLQILGF